MLCGRLKFVFRFEGGEYVEKALGELRERLGEVYDLRAAAGLLVWDRATMMPPKGAESRGRQTALLGRLAHEKFTAPRIGELLDELPDEDFPYDSDEAGLLRTTRRQYERESRKPADLVSRLARHSAASYGAWAKARPNDDFEAVRPFLEETLELSRELAACFPESEHPADALIAETDPGMNAASVKSVFSELREGLVPLVEEISERPNFDDSCLRQRFPEKEKMEFAEGIVRRFGYDFERGRCDLTLHPFAIRFGWGDARITTRVHDDDFRYPLLPTMHESGHAMYEQGVREEYEGTPLGRGASAGVHESQSRLWENLVGRSRAFWEHFHPEARKRFASQLGDVPFEEFYGAMNRVEPSLIRTNADEVTYNLHVILRFDFELALLEGSMEVRDLPEVWRERMKKDLVVEVPDDRDGVLQDSHWFQRPIGGVFQGYTLGNVMSVPFYRAALDARPEIEDDIRGGNFETLRAWLTENIYRHGSKYEAPELLENATGRSLTVEPYLDYLRSKYGELYSL